MRPTVGRALTVEDGAIPYTNITPAPLSLSKLLPGPSHNWYERRYRCRCWSDALNSLSSDEGIVSTREKHITSTHVLPNVSKLKNNIVCRASLFHCKSGKNERLKYWIVHSTEWNQASSFRHLRGPSLKALTKVLRRFWPKGIFKIHSWGRGTFRAVK